MVSTIQYFQLIHHNINITFECNSHSYSSYTSLRCIKYYSNVRYRKNIARTKQQYKDDYLLVQCVLTTKDMITCSLVTNSKVINWTRMYKFNFKGWISAVITLYAYKIIYSFRYESEGCRYVPVAHPKEAVTTL